MLYFDHNATSPMCEPARQTWLDTIERYVGNPSSPHRIGSRADKVLEDSRDEAARLLGFTAPDLTWTSGATEANNIVIHHYSLLPGEAWISGLEHPSVLEPAKRWFGERLFLIPVQSNGVIDLGWLQQRLRSHKAPSIVGLMAANNETGVLQPWQEVAQLCRDARVPFLCDASQWVGKLPSRGFGVCDHVTCCAHKFGGPVGIGLLLGAKRITPLLYGGPQEDGLRPGTENIAGIRATVAALRFRLDCIQVDGFLPSAEERRAEFVRVLSRRLPDAKPTSDAEALWNTVSLVMPEIDCRQRWVVKIDKLGAAVSTGSACSSGKETISHVLSAMHVVRSAATRVLRISGGWETTAADWDKLLEILESAAATLKDEPRSIP